MRHTKIWMMIKIVLSMILIMTSVFPAFGFAATVTSGQASSITLWVKWDVNATYLHYRLPTQSWAKSSVLPLMNTTIPGFKGATIQLGRLKNAEIIVTNSKAIPNYKKSTRYTLNGGTYTISKKGFVKGMPINHKAIVFFPDNEFNQTYLQYKIEGSSWISYPGKIMAPSTIPGYLTKTISMGEAKSLLVRINDGTLVNGGDTEAVYQMTDSVYTILNGKIIPGAPNDTEPPVISPIVVPTNTPMPVATITPVVSSGNNSINTATPISTPTPVPTAYVDVTAPTIPSNVQLSILASGAVGITWNLSTDLSGIDAYIIYRNDVKQQVVSGNSFVDKGFSPNNTYIYKVQAIDKANNLSSLSEGVKYQAPADISPPTAPLLNLTSSSETKVSIGWTASEDNYGVAVYEVYRDGIKVAESKDLVFSESGLAPKQSVKYSIRSVDVAGNRSLFSNEIIAVTPEDKEPPTAPTSLTAIGRSDNSITVLWGQATDNVQVKLYEVLRNNVVVNTTTSTFFTDKGLKPNEVYQYNVKAIDSSGNRSLKAVELLTSTTDDKVAPTAPTVTQLLSKNDSAVKIGWNPGSDNNVVSGYQIFRNGKQISVVGSVNNFEDTSVSSGTEYTYTVRSVDASGNVSADSVVLKVTTDLPVTIYYKSTGTTYVSYGYVSSGTTASQWTVSPGVKLDESEYIGYKKIDIKLGSYSSIQAAFNNGDGIWDNNNYKNYSFTKGLYTIVDKVIVTGKPVASLRPTTTPVVTSTPLATGTPYVKPSSSPNGTDTEKPSVPLNLKVLNRTATTIQFGWSASSDNVEVTKYDVYENGVFVASVSAGIQLIKQINLSPDSIYAYSVVAIDKAGNRSAASATLTTSTTNQMVSVFYNTSITQPMFHYRLEGSNQWTIQPGIPMNQTNLKDWFKVDIDLAAAQNVAEAAFYVGMGSLPWDNNGNKNYRFEPGTWSVSKGVMTKGTPAGYATLTPLPTATPTISPLTTPVIAKQATVYYYSNESVANLHYTLDGITWTTLPGLEMIKSEFADYYKKTITIGSAKNAQVAFNNGKSVWNSNGNKNYLISEGVWTVNNENQLLAGTPVPAVGVTTSPNTIATPLPTPIVVTETPLPTSSITPVTTTTPVPAQVVVTLKVNYDTQGLGDIWCYFRNEVGAWSNTKMTMDSGNNWTISELLTPGLTYQYKYFKLIGTDKAWESIDSKNHVLIPTTANIQTQIDTWGLNLK